MAMKDETEIASRSKNHAVAQGNRRCNRLTVDAYIKGRDVKKKKKRNKLILSSPIATSTESEMTVRTTNDQ